MKTREILRLIGFYENELTNNILFFWLPRCLDQKNGGYFNCYDNRGETLVSRDKYTWSQGRFAWLFARLAAMDGPTFSAAQRQAFLEWSRSGCDFLENHCLIGDNDWRCVFLMDETGKPKPVVGWEPLDMSIYADCFVVAAMARYAETSGDAGKYQFGKTLYESCCRRIDSGRFNTLPYPLSDRYRAHGIPMILSNTTAELFRAARIFEPEYSRKLLENLSGFATDILDNFVDENYIVHEIIGRDNAFIPGLLGQHANPGHTIEDMWFMTEAAELLGRSEWTEPIARISLNTLQIGWDKLCGGLLHYCGAAGGEPAGAAPGAEGESMLQQVRSGWGDKLWWVHAEALYTTLLCYERTGDRVFLDWHDRIFDYTFAAFPNPNREIREWVQILRRDGAPQDKVVALPVKDPYHIIRSLILIIELLYQMKSAARD